MILILSILILLIALIILTIKFLILKNNSHNDNKTNFKYVFSKKFSDSINYEDIIGLYNNDTTFDEEGLPNGGLLVTMISNGYIENKNWFPNANQCDTKVSNVPDLSDINKLLTDTAKENQTTCVALDTTYLSYNAPGILFGPIFDMKGGAFNMNIGIILDVNKIKKYIACMFPSDAGSVTRVNPIGDNNNDLTDDDLKNYEKTIRTSRGRQLANAGCGLQKTWNTERANYSGGIYNSNAGINTPFPTYAHNGYYNYQPGTYSDKNFYPMQDVSNNMGKLNHSRQEYNIGTLIDQDYVYNDKFDKDVFWNTLPNGWFNNIKSGDKYLQDSDGKKINNFLSGYFYKVAQPYKRSSFNYFIYQIKNKFKSIINYGGYKKYWDMICYRLNYNWDLFNMPYYGGNLNQYHENEVDMYIPQIKGHKNGDPCQVTDEFKKVWEDSIIGIFTNHRCLENVNNISLINSSGANKKVGEKPDFDSLSTDIKNNILKHSAGNPNDYILGKLDCNSEDYSCTCSCNNYEYLDNCVIELVKKFNESTGKKINGYIMNDDMKLGDDFPEDFDTKKITKPLKIKQITNY